MRIRRKRRRRRSLGELQPKNVTADARKRLSQLAQKRGATARLRRELQTHSPPAHAHTHTHTLTIGLFSMRGGATSTRGGDVTAHGAGTCGVNETA